MVDNVICLEEQIVLIKIYQDGMYLVPHLWGMFGGAVSFNQDLSNWDVSNNTRFDGMFT